MRVELFLAARYLKPQRTAVGIITLISVIGVALGVGVLIIVLAVMTGFTDLMKQKLLDTQAHFQIGADFNRPIDFNRRQIAMNSIAEIGGAGAPVINAQAMAQVPQKFGRGYYFDPAVMVLGATEADLQQHMQLDKNLLHGELRLEKGDIIISDDMASALRWNVNIGDRVLLHSPQHLTKMVKMSPDGAVEVNKEDAEAYLPSEFVVRGIYSFNKSDFDRSVVFVSLADAAGAFDLPLGSARRIYGWVEDPMNMASEMETLNAKLSPYGLKAYSWHELNSSLLGVLAVEKRMMFFLLIFIVIVAAFSITNTLITSVYQKTREIGILKSLGAADSMVLRVFLYQGLLVGVLGSFLGTILGVLVIAFRNNILNFGSWMTGQDLFPKEFYVFNELPAKIVVSDVLLIVVVSIVLCTLGAFIPALKAAKLDPAKALRYE